MSDPTDTSAEAVERIRLYVDYPHTSRDMVVLDSALVRLTAGDLADLLAERDTLAAERDALRARADAAEAERDRLRAIAERTVAMIARGRVIDARAEKVAKEGGSGTPVMWAEEAYDELLADLDRDARAALTAPSRPSD